MSPNFRHRLAGIAIGLSATLAVLLFSLSSWTSPAYEAIELKFLDMRFNLRTPLSFRLGKGDEQVSVITHIDIDDASVEEVGRWPWPRERQADLIDALTELGAFAIMYDVEFLDPSQKVVEDAVYTRGLATIDENLNDLASMNTADTLRSTFSMRLPRGVEQVARTEVDASLVDVLEQYQEDYTRIVGRHSTEIQRQIDSFVKDHDHIMAEAVERSGLVRLAYHFDFPKSQIEALVPRFPEVREILTREPELTEERFAERMGLHYSSIKGYLPAIRHQVFLSDKAVQQAMQEWILDDVRWELTQDQLAERLGVHPAHLMENMPILRTRAVEAVVDRVLDADPYAEVTTCLGAFALGSVEAAMDLPDPTGETRSLDPRLDELVRSAYDRRRALQFLHKNTAVHQVVADRSRMYQSVQVAVPIYDLASSARRLGYVSTLPDAVDGVLRRVPLAVLAPDDSGVAPWAIPEDQPVPVYYQIAFQTVLDYVQVPVDKVQVHPGDYVLVPGARIPGEDEPLDIRIPVDDRCNAIINWAGAPGTDITNVFDHVPAVYLLRLARSRSKIDQTRKAILQQLLAKNGGRLRVVDAARLATVAPHLPDAVGDPETPRHWQDVWTRLGSHTDEVDRVLELYFESIETLLLRFPEGTRERRRASFAKADEVIQQYSLDLQAHKDQARQDAETLRPLVASRICVVGDIHTASTDLKPTPIHAVYPGVGIHTHLMNTILQRSFLRAASSATNRAILFACGAVVAVLAVFGASGLNALLSVIAALGYFGVSLWLFGSQGLWVDVAGPVMAMGLAFTSVTAFRQLTEERQKRELRNAFSLYMTPAVVEDVIRNPDKLKLGGERRILTVYFSDVAGFTSISEAMEPEDLVNLLNKYLGDMTEVILRSGGTLDKYIGDAIMAFWGAPLDMQDHARVACHAALDCKAQLRKIQQELVDQGYPRIDARVGLHSGPMVVGNMGSATRFNYTVMGDSVNLAARLEPANKTYGTDIMISESTLELAGDSIEVREMDLLQVKGKQKPVTVYELMAKKGELGDEVKRMRDLFHDALKRYRSMAWDDAIAGFHKALEHVPQDEASRMYVERCRHFQAEPPPGEWNGVYEMKTK